MHYEGGENLAVWCASRDTVLFIDQNGTVSFSDKEYLQKRWNKNPGRPVNLQVEVK